MKIARLASLMLVAILAVGLAVASVAAAEPEFTPVGASITGTSGEGKFTAGTEVVTCAKDTLTSGTGVTTATLIGNLTVHFLECTAKNAAGETCPAMSAGAPLENLILTKTLHGVLGLILPKPETGSGVALLVLPTGGGEFYKLLGKCIPETIVEGDVAGIVEPVGSSVTTGTIKFPSPAIKNVDLSTGGAVTVKLKWFGVAATDVTTESITYSKATEVT